MIRIIRTFRWPLIFPIAAAAGLTLWGVLAATSVHASDLTPRVLSVHHFPELATTIVGQPYVGDPHGVKFGTVVLADRYNCEADAICWGFYISPAGYLYPTSGKLDASTYRVVGPALYPRPKKLPLRQAHLLVAGQRAIVRVSPTVFLSTNDSGRTWYRVVGIRDAIEFSLSDVVVAVPSGNCTYYFVYESTNGRIWRQTTSDFGWVGTGEYQYLPSCLSSRVH